MGLIDRIAKAILEKAPTLPAGSVTMSQADMQNRTGGSIGQSYGNNTPLPRNDMLIGVPFGPGLPITPGAINPLRADGRPDPRRYEYQVAQNINITETRLVPFKTLRAAADQIDIVRRCLEVLKAKVSGLEWDITLGEDAAERIIAESGESNHVRAMAAAREKYTKDIYRLRSFWENPDPSNGLTFTDWLMVALEEILVIDAWAVWPQKSVGGSLLGLQILDGATIKPLLDDRGMRPVAPYPAYQQILYGFPRSEFQVNTDGDKADGEFTSDDLSYMIRNRRTISVYGLSPVERSLALADLYLRRQSWLRAEYTDGTTPALMFKTDATWGNNPDLLLAYENIFNDQLAGQTEQRKRARLLPTGMEPIFEDGYGEKFKDTLDNYLVHSICGHFGVMPTEIGFSAKGGLGASGHQQGESESAQAIGVGPLTTWLGKMITNLSYSYLDMPRELEFQFMPSNKNDTEEQARKSDLEIKGGTRTVNERRSQLGLPLIETPEADQAMLVAGAGVFMFTPDGLVNVAAPEAPAEAPADGKPAEAPKPKPVDETNTTKAVSNEMKAFLKWANKGKRGREFEFKSVEPIVGEALNRCYADDDMDTAYSLAKAYLT